VLSEVKGNAEKAEGKEVLARAAKDIQ